jgi:hypothetical protein
MWLYMIAGALVVLGVLLAFVGGGIFTIVLIPLGLIVLGTGLISAASSRRAQAEASGTDSGDVTDRPLPHSPPRDTGRVPTSPEGLADARRAQQ